METGVTVGDCSGLGGDGDVRAMDFQRSMSLVGVLLL